MYGSYHCSYTLSSKIHPKMLHTLRPHTSFCLEMEYKIVKSPRLQGFLACLSICYQTPHPVHYTHSRAVPEKTATLGYDGTITHHR